MKSVLFFLLASASLFAGPVPEGGRSVLPPDWRSATEFRGSRTLAKAAAADFGDGRQGWRVEVLNDKSGPSQLQLTTAVEGEVKLGDKLLLAFDARCVADSSADGRGRGQVVVEIKDPPNFPKLGQDVFEVGADWQTIYIAFPANTAAKPGLTYASLMPGGRKQTMEIANLRLLNYGPDFDMAKLPRPRLEYPGRAADAPWRKAALERIEKIRTTGIGVEVVDAAGRPVADAKVSLELKRHAFAFGTAVKAKFLMGPDPRAPKYREMVDRYFSSMVLENDLKPFGWEGGLANKGDNYRLDWTMKSLEWAKERGMWVRGHYLCWGPWEPWSEALKDQPEAIKARIMNHLDGVLKGTAGLVDEWDAVNHPVGWNNPRATVDQVAGADLYAEVFKAARARTGAPLWINEDQVFRPGRQQEEFYQLIKDLIARGVRPDGIGNQAHFHSSSLPGAEELLRISDRFAGLVPKLEITEFDVNTNGDEELQADWLRDCLIMSYSHPAYRAFILWVFWEGTGYKPDLALWRKDWTEKPNGRVWRELVNERWRTKANGSTNAAGGFDTRGHRGLYEITVEAAGRRVTQPFNTEDGSGLLRVVF
jgi:GH35 family endo-1,4-beta-xylanase